LETEPSEKIIEKLATGETKVAGVKPKKAESAVRVEGEAHLAEDAKVGTEAPDETKKSAKAKAPAKQKKKPELKPKEPAIPSKSFINRYGFIGVGVDMLEAMGLQRAPKGQKGKLAKNTPITFESYDPETRTLTIRLK